MANSSFLGGSLKGHGSTNHARLTEVKGERAQDRSRLRRVLFLMRLSASTLQTESCTQLPGKFAHTFKGHPQLLASAPKYA
eukprot:1579112-Pleurochrysis_carterae.AAC.1